MQRARGFLEGPWVDRLREIARSLILCPAGIILALVVAAGLLDLLVFSAGKVAELHTEVLRPGGSPLDFLALLGMVGVVIVAGAGLAVAAALGIGLAGALVVRVLMEVFVE